MQTPHQRFADSKPDEIVNQWKDPQGPTAGPITLPQRLCWAPYRTLDLSTVGGRRVLVREVMDNGTKEDQARYLSGEIIQSVWNEMFLPPATRQRWAAKFPDKLSEVGNYDQRLRARSLVSHPVSRRRTRTGHN